MNSKDTGTEENIIEIFDNSYNKVTDATTQLREMEEKSMRAMAEVDILKETNGRLHSECCKLEENLKSCQERLNCVCELENKIWKLEEELVKTNESLQTEINQHKIILENLQKDHAKAKEEIINVMKTECAQEIATITSHWKEAVDAKISLESQLRTLENERKREVAKMTMEYETKLLKASRQKADFLQQHNQVMNQDAIRKKMQHMKENYEGEIASLKVQISNLQQKLDSTKIIKSEDENENPSPEKQKRSRLQLIPHHNIFKEKQSTKRSSLFEPDSLKGRKCSKP